MLGDLFQCPMQRTTFGILDSRMVNLVRVCFCLHYIDSDVFTVYKIAKPFIPTYGLRVPFHYKCRVSRWFGLGIRSKPFGMFRSCLGPMLPRGCVAFWTAVSQNVAKRPGLAIGNSCFMFFLFFRYV